MSTPQDHAIRERARRAYERARIINALALAAVVVIPTVSISAHCCPTPNASLLCGLILGSAIALARFAGRGIEAALRPGLVAGVIAFAFPLVCHGLMACSDGLCASPRLKWIPLVAVVAGLFGGLALRALSRGGSFLVASFTALLLGSLGSLVIGISGPLWTALGLLAGVLIPLRPASREA
ncbi:MAG: hypothetical protein KBH14_01400 [Vicinamibacteria bacterium]|nr:hypothetical protein [Vicinamibacteria bacterium]MBP9945033.1 hypothetical protein [Vicinamibacteria bacterium]